MLDDITRQKIIALLTVAETAELTSVDDFGYPITKTMEITSEKGLDEVWFATDRDADKVNRFRKNPKSNVHFLIDGQQVSLVGDIEIRDDFIARHVNWHDDLQEMYPLGPSDPDYVLLRFKPHYASFESEGVQTNGRV